MQLTQSSSSWANQWYEHKPLLENKSKLENPQNQLQNSHLEETSRRLRKPGCSFLTQEYTDANWEDTAQPMRPQQKRVQTDSLKQNGYLGEIRFESRKGGKREFPVFADSEIGIKQNAQTILIDQEWDEDIETDESCKRKAMHKCMKQLSIAIRDQSKGINPTKKKYEQEYQDLEQRFAQENMQIAFDYQNLNVQQQQEQRQNHSQGSQEEEQLMVSMSAVNQLMDRMLSNNRNSNNTREMVSQANHNNLSQQFQHKHTSQQQNNTPPFADIAISQSSSPSYHSLINNQSQQQPYPPICQPSVIKQQLFNENHHLRQESAAVALINSPSCNSQSSSHSQRDGYFQQQLPTLEDIIEMETILDSPLFSAGLNSHVEFQSFEGHCEEDSNLEQQQQQYHDIDDYCNTAEDLKSKEVVFPPQVEEEDHLVMVRIPSQESFFNSRIQLHTQQTYQSAYQFSDFQDISFSI